MKFEVRFVTSDKKLNPSLRDFFKFDNNVKVDFNTKRVGKNLFQFSLWYDFYDRNMIHDFLEHDKEFKTIKLKYLTNALDKEVIMFEHTMMGSVNADTHLSLHQSKIERDDFWQLSSDTLRNDIKPWEDWNDLLMRIPDNWKQDVFTCTIAGLVYDDVAAIHLGNLNKDEFSEFKLWRQDQKYDQVFPEHKKFMYAMGENGLIDMQEVRLYLKYRYEAGRCLNKMHIKGNNMS